MFGVYISSAMQIRGERLYVFYLAMVKLCNGKEKIIRKPDIAHLGKKRYAGSIKTKQKKKSDEEKIAKN